jgi:hypothetical protein
MMMWGRWKCCTTDSFDAGKLCLVLWALTEEALLQKIVTCLDKLIYFISSIGSYQLRTDRQLRLILHN